MTVTIRNTRELVGERFRFKVLLYGLPGVGKTSWLAGVPNIGIAACETGTGKGLLSVADRGLDFCEPTSLADFAAICSGSIFKDKAAVGLDSLSEMSRTFIKDAALSIPRKGFDSPKRSKGVPELDDYGVMAELTRKYLRGLLDLDKHVVVTATEKVQMPDAESGRGEYLVGPELPGQMFTGSAAMFDFVLRLRTRPKLRTPGDKKSQYIERYFITNSDGAGTIAKCRSNVTGKPLLDLEEIWDPATGRGSFQYLLDKILAGYAAEGAAKNGV